MGSLTYSISGSTRHLLIEFYCGHSASCKLWILKPLRMLEQTADIRLGCFSDGVNAVTQTLCFRNQPQQAPVVDILPTNSITGTSATIEGNLTAYTGGTQPCSLIYDNDSTHQLARTIPSVPFGMGPKLALCWTPMTVPPSPTSTVVGQWSDKSEITSNGSGDQCLQTQDFGSHSKWTKSSSFDGDDFLQKTTTMF